MIGKKYTARVPVDVHEDCTWEPGTVVEVTHVYDDDGGFDLTADDGESGSFAPRDIESWFTPEPEEPPSIADAFQMVIELARENVIDIRDDAGAHAAQMEACDLVEDFVTNNFGDDELTSVDFDAFEDVGGGDGPLVAMSKDECQHEIDWGSASLSYDGEMYIDVNCKKCGHSGCLGSVKWLEKEVCW